MPLQRWQQAARRRASQASSALSAFTRLLVKHADITLALLIVVGGLGLTNLLWTDQDRRLTAALTEVRADRGPRGLERGGAHSGEAAGARARPAQDGVGRS